MGTMQFLRDSFDLIKLNYRDVLKSTFFLTLIITALNGVNVSISNLNSSTSIISEAAIFPVLISSLLTIMLTLTYINANKQRRTIRGMQQGDVWATVSQNGDLVDLILLNLLIFLYTFFWGMLFVIPGLVKGFSYSQANYIYFENKHKGNRISYNEAITLSRSMMKGHKFELFCIQLVLGIINVTALAIGALVFGLIMTIFLPLGLFLFLVAEFFVFAFILNWSALTNANFYMEYK